MWRLLTQGIIDFKDIIDAVIVFLSRGQDLQVILNARPGTEIKTLDDVRPVFLYLRNSILSKVSNENLSRAVQIFIAHEMANAPATGAASNVMDLRNYFDYKLSPIDKIVM